MGKSGIVQLLHPATSLHISGCAIKYLVGNVTESVQR